MNGRAFSALFGRAPLWALTSLVVLLCGAAPLRAQVDAGSILGTVSDASGGSVHGATVTLTNEGTNASLSTTTSADGTYKFSPVRIGSYKLTATLQGASVGQVVDSRSVDNFPLNGRNFTFLAQLAAGVNTPQADTRGNAASGAFAANGLRPAQNNYLLDGIDNNSDTVDFLNGTNFVVLPPVDAVEEFKVQTSDFSAEFGRSGAAVLNATIKSGTNNFHGAAWEFFRNDKLDAADFFENAGGRPKGALRQNQFGFTAGGPVVIPKVFNGRNKVFFFGDYEGLRRVQGTILTGSVPTLAERNAPGGPYTDLSDLITGQSGTQTDALGRTMPTGTILDPATTRQISPGVFVRDPFFTASAACPAATTTFTLAACNLNHIPAGRLDPNAIKLLNLYPLPTTSSLFSNFANSPKLFEHRNSFDARMDFNLNEKNQVFYRFSLVDDPQFIPGIFKGVADGGGFQQGTQTANAQQSALGYTHTFSPTLINVLRGGLNYLHTTRVSPSANDLTNIPKNFNILGIPQLSENGGLPAFGINGLQTLGSNAFLPSDEVSSTIQVTDDLTKIYGKHTFKLGIEVQHVKFSTLQPPWSRGEFDFSGLYTEIPGVGGGNTGRAQFLLAPALASVPGGINYVGGPSGGSDDGLGHNGIFISNISLTDNGKNYYGGYVNDDVKVTRNLTVNLGLRYDFFGLVYEHHSNQANFVPAGPPINAPLYIIPQGANAGNLSPSFLSLLAKDGITLDTTNRYGKGLGKSQTTNFSPRLGLAYQVTPKLVARAGFGLFYNGFENRGFSPNIGENYPFQFNFQFQPPDAAHPITFTNADGTPCTTAGPGGSATGNATFETGFSCTPLSPLLVNASGLALRGIQFDYITPYSMSGNLTLQYQLTSSMSVQAGYVTSLARHLEVFPGSNTITSLTSSALPFPDFGQNASYAATEGNSAYHGLQTKVEKRFAGGLNFLATYTWSKVRTDAHDLLNGGSIGGYRAPNVPGFGIQGDYSLAPFDIRNVFHFSGGYEFPFGKGKRFFSDASGFANKAVGGWSVIWSATLQGGQPITLSCPSGTVSGAGCYDLLVGDPKLGLHTDAKGKLNWYGNPAAFAQPCALGAGGVPNPTKPKGCVPLTGFAALGGGSTQVVGPGFHRLDFSVFKDIPFTERFRLQLRTEIFNVFNHPNFNAPNFGGNGVVAISGSGNFTNASFGEIGSTRDAPYDPRQIQFALKLYY